MAETMKTIEPFSLEKIGVRDGGEVYKVGLVFAGLPERMDPWIDLIPKSLVTKVVAPPQELRQISFKGMVFDQGVKATTIITFDKDGCVSKIQINVVVNVDPSNLPEVLRTVAQALDAGSGAIDMIEVDKDQNGSFDTPESIAAAEAAAGV
jgi:hypothetical protein